MLHFLPESMRLDTHDVSFLSQLSKNNQKIALKNVFKRAFWDICALSH